MSHSERDNPMPALADSPPRHRLQYNLLTALAATLFCPPLTAPAKEGGWDFEPYHIQITIAIDAPGGLAEQLTDELPGYFQRRIEASLFPSWSCDVHVATSAERVTVFAAVEAPSDAM